MFYEATLHYTKPVLRKSAFMLWRRRSALATAFFVGLSVLTFLLMWLTKEEARNMWMAAGATAVGLLLSAWVYVLCYRALVNYFRSGGRFSMQVRLEEASFSFRGGTEDLNIQWSAVKELLKTRSVWLLLLEERGRVVVFPVKLMSLQMRVFLEERVRAAGAKTRVYIP